jgi:predicted amidohydrolase YtcJ
MRNISDMWFGEERLGSERIKMLYPFRTIWDSGARVAFGSDFPVETINPLAEFYSANTRSAFDGISPHVSGGWFPEQRLTRLEALQGMTINPAYASFTENSLGSLEPGKRADYVVLSQDIMTIQPLIILQTKVLATSLDGQVVYGKI